MRMNLQEGVYGRGTHKSGTNSPYQIWLARKVERAVERALQHEGQQILEEVSASRKWGLPQICEERHLVTTKIHSLLLQWRPDFSAEWSLKLRRALPILEILFAHMASSKEDFSNPLLIEPRLKGVVSLLDSNSHNRSPLGPIQSSNHHRFANYFYCFHHPCHYVCSADRIEAADMARACKLCLHSGEERFYQKGQENSFCRSCLDADKEGQDLKEHEICISPNLGEKRPSQKTHKAISCLSESCLDWEERLDTRAQNALVFGSCLGIADKPDEGIIDDSLEWSTINLPSTGTVASLMASELRSSRKEEANQALWNALASEEVALLKDNLQKHGEFASKWMVSKIMKMLKRRKKIEKHQKINKNWAGQLLHDAAEEKIPCAELPLSKMRRSFRKGLFGLFSCHTIASQEHDLPSHQKPLPFVLEASESKHPCCLVSMDSKHVGKNVEDDLIQAELPVTSSSNMISSNASSVDSSSDVDSEDGNDNSSCHTHCDTTSLCGNSIHETFASIVTHSIRINGSEELSTFSRAKNSDDAQRRMLSKNVSTCHHTGEAGITVRALLSCMDVQIDLGQGHLHDSNGVLKSIQEPQDEQVLSYITSAGEDRRQIDKYDPQGASMVSCCHHDESASRESPSGNSHIEDHDDGIRPLECRSSTNTLSQEKKGEGACSTKAYAGAKGRREDPPNCSVSLEDLASRDPCENSVDIMIDRSGHNNMKHESFTEDKMQTSFLHKDGESQEESAGASRCLRQNDENETQVAEAPTESRITQSSDGGASSGSRRARTSLSSLLAERNDWNAQSVMSSFRSWGSSCPWDTWEEPDEALDPLCCVCMMGLKGAAFTSCGHTFCRKCSRELWQGRGTCPLCNKLITGILDIF